MTHPVYEQILEELASGELNVLERKVFEALRRSYPQPLTRRHLIQACQGYLPDERANLNNNPDDRKNRKAIVSLFRKGIPAVASSSEAGYRLDFSEETMRKLIGEYESRMARLRERVRAAEALIYRIHLAGPAVIPTQFPEPEPAAEQLVLIPMESNVH